MSKSMFDSRFLVLQLVFFFVVVAGCLTDCFGQKEFDPNSGAIAQKSSSIEPVAEFQLAVRNSSTARWGAMLGPDARRLVTWEHKSHHAFLGGTSWRENVKLWDVTAERQISTLEGAKVTAGDFAFSPSGEQFAYFDERHLFVVNTDSGEEITKVKLPGVFRVQFLANHPRLLISSFVDGRPKLGNNRIQVQQMDIETWTLKPLSCGFIESDIFRSSMQVTDKGRLWFKGKDYSIVCWDLESDQEVVRIKSIADDLRSQFKGVLITKQFQFLVDDNRLCVLVPIIGSGRSVVKAFYRLDDGELDAVERDSQESNEELTHIGSWADRTLSDNGIGPPMMRALQSMGKVIDAGDRWDLIDSLNFRVDQSIPWTIEDLKSIGIPPKADIQLTSSSTNDVITIAFQSLAAGKVYALDIQDDSIVIQNSTSTRLPVERTIVNRERNLIAAVGYWRHQTRRSGDDCELVLMKFPTLTHHQTIDVGKVRPKRVVFSSDGNWIGGVFESIEKQPKGVSQVHSWVKIWDTNSGQLLFEFDLGNQFDLGIKLATGLTFHPDGGMLAVGGTEWVQIWDLNSKKKVKELRLSKSTPAYDGRGQKLKGNYHWLGGVDELIFSVERTLIGLADRGEKLVAWDLESGKSLWLMPLTLSARDMQLDLSSGKLFMTSRSGEPVAIDLETKQMSGKSTGQLFKDANGEYSHSYTVLAASRDQSRLLTVKRVQNAPRQLEVVTVHELATGNRLAARTMGLDRVQDAEWSGQHAMVGGRASSSAKMVIWDTIRKRKIGEITDYSEIHSKFISDGQVLAAKDLYGNSGYTLWYLADASQLAFLPHQGVQEIEESGEALITISPNTLKIWKVPSFADTK